MGTESKERIAIAQVYAGKAWKERVKKMSDDQVVAIYMRLKAQGKIT